MASPTKSPPPQQTTESPAEEDSPTITSEFQNLEISETPTPQPEKGLTENLSATYLSSGNPCLDFFFHVVPDTPPESLLRRLESSWAHHPLTALKLVFNLRGVRGSGKSDREGFYTAALWLHNNHPKTLALNCNAVASFGYFKDLPEILYRLLEGSEVRREQKQEWKSRKNRKGVKGPDKETARALRKERELAKAKRALERYESDENYKFLYDSVCGVFAEMLRSDMELLKLGETGKISLASKWCPSVDSAYDKTILICEGIAKRMFPTEEIYPRDRLRKEVLVPLHSCLQLPEVSMSAGEWSSLPYTRVASVAMKNYKKTFMKRDRERFEAFLEDVKSGKAKIAAGALLPHEIVASIGDDVAELQWERMVKDLRESGKLSGCVAVCDVSGSMSGVPMEVCVALGLLVSELNDGPWKGKVITFSESPEIHAIEGKTLAEKAGFVRAMDWGMTTNFQKVFDLLLGFGGNNIPKRVFVFSDMEFDQACCGDRSWETDYEVIVRKFRERALEGPPEIVFWNLRDSSSTPVMARRPGVALVSGFSKNLLTLFLEGGGIVDPEKVMEYAIDREEYNKLVVYD